MKSKNNRNKNLVVLIATIAATGGLLFGFDTGVISGAQNFLQDPGGWGISDDQLEWVTTAVLIGAVLGAALSGRVSDILGRKKVIIAASVIFALGALATGAAPNISLLVTGRIIIGLAIGIASFSVPMYISEISPTRKRGALVTMNQLMITIGILVSYISDYLIANDANPFSWRWMFYIGLIPALILFIGMFFVPETPRWLIGRGREEEGRKVLNKVEEPDLVEEAIRKIKADIARESESAGYREVFKPWLRTALFIAVGIMFFQQFTGINTIIYYSPKIFKMAGIESNTLTILPSILLGTVNVLFTVVSIMLLDKLGRRPLYFIGLIGMIAGLVGVGLSFFFEESLGSSLKYFTVASMFIYIIFFAVSLGPLGWLIISEVFPLKGRHEPRIPVELAV
jgi:SP family galactose:H+ symporter-like MFS transporter